MVCLLPRKLKEEADVCPLSTETLKNGITAPTLLVILYDKILMLQANITTF